MKRVVPWFCLCVLLQGASGVDVPGLSAFDDLLNGLLTKWQITGAALGVSRHGRLILAHGYGMSELQDGQPVQPESPFRIAGIPKSLTAAALLRLVEEGQIPQADPDSNVIIRELLPEKPGRSHEMRRGAGGYVFRQASAGVDVALLLNSVPSDQAAFEADLSAALVRTVSSIDKWPSIDLSVRGPELFAGDVVNAADYRGGGVVPGEIVVLFPANAGSPGFAEWHLDENGKAAAPIGGTQLFFDNIAAPLVYSLNGQICAVVPYDIANRKTTEVVLEYGGVRSPPVTLPVVASAPALFTLDASGKGPAAMLNETGCCNSVRNPAPRDTVVSLYGTGEGLASPKGIDETISVPGRPAQLFVPKLPVSVTVGGVPAEVRFVRNIGLLQVNVRIPANAPVGDAIPLVLTVGNSRSPDGVTMAIRSAARRVLVVDRNLAVRTRLIGILKGAGYEVLAARDGQMAVAQARDAPVDLVISDLAVPEEESVKLIRAIRQDRPKLKVIAMTATFGPHALRTADMLGAQAVLRKPLTAEMVRRRVNDLLREPPARY